MSRAVRNQVRNRALRESDFEHHETEGVRTWVAQWLGYEVTIVTYAGWKTSVRATINGVPLRRPNAKPTDLMVERRFRTWGGALVALRKDIRERAEARRTAPYDVLTGRVRLDGTPVSDRCCFDHDHGVARPDEPCVAPPSGFTAALLTPGSKLRRAMGGE